MALSPRTVCLGNPPTSTHQIDQVELADLLDGIGRASFDTAADLLANTSLSYEGYGAVTAGDIFTTKDGFAYEAVADGTSYGAAGYHVTNSNDTPVLFRLIHSGEINIVGLGANIDGATDDAPYIKLARDILAVSAISADGFYPTTGTGGNVVLPVGEIAINSFIRFDDYVNLIGSGPGTTRIVCTHADAGVGFGTSMLVDGAFGTATRGGKSRGWVVDGDGVDNNPLVIGFCVERDFEDINGVNGVGDGITVEAAQNCNFWLRAQHNGGDQTGVGSNIVIDYGAGNNKFWGVEVNRPGAYNVKFIQSGTSPVGAFSVPTGNGFHGGVVERWEDADGDGNVYSLGAIYHGAGRLNYFENYDISTTGLPSALSAVKMRRDSLSFPSTNLAFINCAFKGTAGYSTVFDVDGVSGGSVTMELIGRTFMENHTRGFLIGDNGTVLVHGALVTSNVTTFFAAGGSKSQDQLLYRPHGSVTTKHQKSGAGVEAFQVGVDGESFARMQVYPNAIKLGSGSAAASVTLGRTSRFGIEGLSIGDTTTITQFALKLGPVDLIVATGAPAQASPNGSLYMRTDTGQLYVRESGAWVGK